MSDLDGLYFEPGTIELDGQQYSLKELTRINRDDIDGELERLPATIFHAGQIDIGLDIKINEASGDKEVMRSEKYMELRHLKRDEKITEETIKAMLKVNPDLLAMEESIEAMRSYKRSIGNLLSALHDKRQSLMILGSRRTEELRNQELSVRHRQ